MISVSRILTDIENEATEGIIAKWLADAEKVVLIGLGNPLRRDDMFGIDVIRRIEGKISEEVMLIEGETTPESYLEQITGFNPSHILIIDAAMINAEPGMVKLLSPEVLKEKVAVSTHSLPLRIFCDYLEKNSRADIALLLVQPKITDFGEGLSSEVEETADRVVSNLTKLLRD
jgi:hydrogenase 3 maturation protease